MSTLLRITTAGSVDDGKSTLIGRLLYDSKALLSDQLLAVHNSKSQRVSALSQEQTLPDLSLLTDGLEAEREQGITIDVAYRYLSTGKRKFIIADSPGHEQYTRNMVTAASNADIAIVLIDVTKLDFGAKPLALLPQTRRHAMLASMLGLKHLIVAVNKMDALGYDEAAFKRVETAFAEFAAANQLPPTTTIPISALHGDNIVGKSALMPWYQGEAILPWLENVQLENKAAPFSLAVQSVLRHEGNRYYLGRVAGSSITVGDNIIVASNGASAKVTALSTPRGPVTSAQAGDAIRLQLDQEIDVSRGDTLLKVTRNLSRSISPRLTWLSTTPMQPKRRYLLRHGTAWTQAQIEGVDSRFDVVAGCEQAATESRLKVNDIVRARLITQQALPFMPYGESPALGAFILVDPASHETLAAGIF